MNPLDELKDIHTPSEISAWPPAYGWWLIAIFILLTVIAITLAVYKRYRHNAARRNALQALLLINSQQPDWPSSTNALLKRVCLHYMPAQKTANLYGHAWCESLTNQLPKSQHESFAKAMSELQLLLYRACEPNDENFDLIQKQVALWIKRAKFTPTHSSSLTGAEHV
ncbi:DUF4381 domain-containing protein [uncultured Paraglaciecola sp.]|uniref:DUF4381 domain-containing protein n=1 Tax=uncultured Paraglaciecola sp. TaxID=1765024 RepID=UPI0030D7C9A6|tara:strand:+ start:8390 stop:8893 length:504 start_codon:yes stop_codon:yes gene_type:complete